MSPIEKWLQVTGIVDQIQTCLDSTDYAEKCGLPSHALAFFLVEILDGLTFAKCCERREPPADILDEETDPS